MRTLVQASEAHLADCRFRQLSPKTLALYGIYERSLIEWCGTNNVPLRLHSLNAANIRACADWIRQRGTGKRGGTWATRAFVATMKLWSRYLVDEDLLEGDYLAKLKRPKATKVARQAYQTWEVQALRGAMLESDTGIRDVAVLSLLLDTGMRIGEAVRIQLGELDLRAHRVKVVWGKGRRERILPFGSDRPGGGSTVKRVQAYLEHRGGLSRGEQSDSLFLVRGRRPLTADAFREAFQKAARRAELSHTEVHGTRHTFAVNFLVKASLQGNQNPVEELRYRLGHLSDDTYRDYIGQAGSILAELRGDESIADAMFDQETSVSPSTRPRLRALPSRGAQPNDGPGPRLQAKDPSAAASQRPRGRGPSPHYAG